MMIDKHTLALVGIVGSSLDVLGTLYLAYDLLGGEHGPLRTLTRGVTYGVLFGGGYGLALGPVFGLASGLAHGITLAWEFSRASRHCPKPGFWYDTAMSAIRGLGFAVGAAYLYGGMFGITFGALSTVGQALAYRVGIRPTMEYQPAKRPRLSKHQLLAAVNRTIGYGVAGYLSALTAHEQSNALSVGVKAGLVIGVVTAIATPCTPFVEWSADHVPEKRMGVFRSWLDPDRFRAAIRPVLADAAGREHPLEVRSRRKVDSVSTAHCQECRLGRFHSNFAWQLGCNRSWRNGDRTGAILRLFEHVFNLRRNAQMGGSACGRRRHATAGTDSPNRWRCASETVLPFF